VITSIYAKNALRPIPGAIAIGALAKTPVAIVAIAVTRQVTAIRAGLSIPACDKIEGFTKMIYAIVRNVVVPAIISVFTQVFRFSSLKILFSIFSLL
jgi:hypothetical protein